MVCSAWNPVDLYKMALPPCHWGFNVVVIEDRLNLIWHQRSVDVALGLPSNIASYALLLLLLSKTAGLRPGELVGTLADCHIYDNHIDNVRELLKRNERKLPTVEIADHLYGLDRELRYDFDIFSWEYDQVTINDYDPHPKIEMGEVFV
jgi:thymidylate synthase